MAYYGYNLSPQQIFRTFSTGHLQSVGFIDGTEVLSTGSLTYLDFIRVVKHLWEKSFPGIPIIPYTANREAFTTSSELTSGVRDSVSGGTTGIDWTVTPVVIGYAMELRRPHTNEPKPRYRQDTTNKDHSIFGQRFQNVISFTVMSKVGTNQDENSLDSTGDIDTAVVCDNAIELFEDFMQEYTPVFKAAGASELVYSRRLSDSEINRQGSDIHKRTVTYMLTTEKLFASKNDILREVVLDVRNYLATVRDQENQATPGIVGVNVIDLYGGSTPNS